MLRGRVLCEAYHNKHHGCDRGLLLLVCVHGETLNSGSCHLASS